VHGLDRWSHCTHDRDRRSSRPERRNGIGMRWIDPSGKSGSNLNQFKMISLSYSKLVMSHDPTFSCSFSRGIIPSPLCPCGVVEDTHHFCFACPLLPLPSPTYAKIFKSKNPSKLKPIVSLLYEKVMTYSNRILPSYETKMKFLQGIIIQAVLTNLIMFLIQTFHPKFSKLIASSNHSVIVETGMSYTIQRYRTRICCF